VYGLSNGFDNFICASHFSLVLRPRHFDHSVHKRLFQLKPHVDTQTIIPT